MYKASFFWFSIFLFAGLSFVFLSTASSPDAARTPTAPPPPVATKTPPAPTRTRQPTRPTSTFTHLPSGGWAARTPTASFTPVNTPTMTASATMTPTLTATLTPTPFLNLHVVVYLDINQNKLFDRGEGVNDLLLLIGDGNWSTQIIMQNGEAWLALPVVLVPSSDVQVQSPYLHWSKLLRAPKPGEILESELRLEQPQFPASLP